jgi:hypothetical protein
MENQKKQTPPNINPKTGKTKKKKKKKKKKKAQNTL